MGRFKKLLSNTAILGAGTFISKVLVFLLMPLYTACLSSAEFGVADILMQTANLIIPIAVIGIADGLFRFTIDADPSRRKQIFTISVITLLIGMIPLALLIQICGLFSVYQGYVWLVFFYICAANLHLIAANYVRGCDKTKTFALQGIINTALVIILNIIFLVVFDMGVTGYLLSVVLADFLVSIGLILFCKLYKDITLKGINKGLVREIFKFSIPYIPLTLMWTITSVSDRFVILATLGDNATSINGLYAAAYKLPTLITIAGGIFMKAWHISSVSESDERERSAFFGNVYKNYLCLMFAGGACLIAFSKLFTKILLDDSYYSSWQYVPILAIAMIFSTFTEFLGSVYFVHKRSSRSLVTAAVGALTNIVLNFTLIPIWGASGAAVATAACYGLVFLIRVVDTQKFIRFERSIVKTTINTVLIIAQVAFMVIEPPYWWVYQIGFVAFALVFNGKEVLHSVLKLIKK